MTSIRSGYRTVDHAGSDQAVLTEAWTHADGYSLVQWRDAVPEEIIGDIAALQTRLMLDAPTGDLAVEQKSYDADRVRREEATQLGRGYHWYSTAARQPAHRGRRLGVLVKSANHAYARAHEPALQVIDAWNADENTHMRQVNARLGFQPVDGWSVFHLPVPTT